MAPPNPPTKVATSIQTQRDQARAVYKVSSEANGGADQDRTGDLLNAIQALSQTELQPHEKAGRIARAPEARDDGRPSWRSRWKGLGSLAALGMTGFADRLRTDFLARGCGLGGSAPG